MCAPDNSSTFQFTPTANGDIDRIIVNCSYKPYNPYIQAAPNFGRLYGQNFDDTRGLIVQGDFSLPSISDAWASYQQNNKNYLNIFNRETQSIELQNAIQNAASDRQLGANGISTAVGALLGIGGVVAAPFTGGASLALTAAGLGMTGANLIKDSVIGGTNRNNQIILQNEALDSRLDLFNYNLGNVKALPQGISKSGCLTLTYKYFIYIEEYDATEEERALLANKITYNGMTVNAVGSIGSYGYTGGFFKGKLIRLENITDDFHFINAIAAELDKGVFL